VETNIGYECAVVTGARSIGEYTRDLGYSAIRFCQRRSGAMVSIQGGKMVPMYFPTSWTSGKTRVR